MPALRQFVGVPKAVLDRLDDPKKCLTGCDIDVKSYCDTKWSLPEGIATGSTARRVSKIRGQMESAELNEEEAYSLLFNVLDGVDLEPAGCSKTLPSGARKLLATSRQRQEETEEHTDQKTKTDVQSAVDLEPVSVKWRR